MSNTFFFPAADEARQTKSFPAVRKKVVINEVTGELKTPSGKDPFENASLTLTLGYSLNFLDSRVPGSAADGGPIIVRDKDLGWCARDLNDYLFPILDWGYSSIKEFVKLFQQGEQIWNHRFLIKPSDDFDRLDYSTPDLSDCVLRPNILCLFRMVSGAKVSKIFNVVRINPEVLADKKLEMPNLNKTVKPKPARDGFRSHSSLLTYGDVHTPALGHYVFPPNLGHELGHALTELHILALKGDAQCKVDPNLDRCYGQTLEELRNIMGVGTDITEINVGPWIDHLQIILGGDRMHSKIVMLTDPNVQPLPPRRIPIAKPKPVLGGRR
jgi:hypothetical protein